MRRASLILILLFVGCFSLAAYLQPRYAARQPVKSDSQGAIVMLLGDGKEIFAARLFAKADAYFHRGRYPSIFEQKPVEDENHMAGEAHSLDQHDTDREEEEHKVAPPGDWIEAFGRHFTPGQHVHLEGGNEREMLPWLQLSAELDPTNTETYVVGAYWLRRLNKSEQAEQFVRQGLKQNPHSPDLLYTLGDIYFHDRKDYDRARNLWRAGAERWHETEEKKEPKQQNKVLLEQILSGLKQVELETGHLSQAIEYLKQLKQVSPLPQDIQLQIDELEARERNGEAKSNRPVSP